jgi:hypothetical protein
MTTPPGAAGIDFAPTASSGPPVPTHPLPFGDPGSAVPQTLGSGARALPFGCGRCDARWSGTSMAHCSACCTTFGSVAAFDRHRTGPLDDRRCRDEAEMLGLGLEPNERGTWRTPRPVDSLPAGPDEDVAA